MSKDNSLAKKFLYYASKSETQSEQILLCADLITAAYNENPFAKASEVQQKVCTCLEQDFNIKPYNVIQIYKAAKDVVIPFLSSGEKIAQADAQLDHIAKISSDNLFESIYDKDGNFVDKKFSASTANTVVNAVKAKMSMLATTQKNVLDAQKQAAEQRREEKELNLGQANREQLQNFLKQKLLNNPELAAEIIKKNEENAKGSNKDFYKGI